MKITLNKDLTAVSQVAMVKAAMKDFKVAYTEGDLLRAFEESWKNVTGKYCCWYNPEILKCEVDSFPKNSWSDEVHFRVDMVLYNGFDQFWTISFYVDQELTVDERTVPVSLINCEAFRKVPA